ncbi:MAG: hypothetical protein ABII39_00335 [Candidatus Micrarchaeota archaeon]
MQKVTLPNGKMKDLFLTFNDLKPQEIVTLKEEDGVKTVIRMEKIVDTIDKSLESFNKLIREAQEKQSKIIEKHKDKIAKAEEDDKPKAYEVQNKEIDKMIKELKVEEEAKKEITVELSDSHHEFAKLAFDKLAMKKFNDIKVCVEIAKALGIDDGE